MYSNNSLFGRYITEPHNVNVFIVISEFDFVFIVLHFAHIVYVFKDVHRGVAAGSSY